MAFKKGDKLLCHWGADYYLTKGKTYTAIEDEQAGQFPSDPYVTVMGDHDKPVLCFAGRFTLQE